MDTERIFKILFLLERYDRELTFFERFSVWLIDYARQIFEANSIGTRISAAVDFQNACSTSLESPWCGDFEYMRGLVFRAHMEAVQP